jgi:hypothetical protein
MNAKDKELELIKRVASVDAWLGSSEMIEILDSYVEILKKRKPPAYTYVERRCPIELEDAMHALIDNFLEQHGHKDT